MFRSIKTKLGAIILIGVSFITLIFLSTFWLINSQEEHALIINLTGRQRMLSQKMARELHAYLHMGILPAKDQAAETRNLFDQTLKSLRYGGKAIDAEGKETTIPPLPSTKGIREVLDESLDLWNIFNTQINIILSKKAAPAEVEKASNYIEKNNIILLNKMNLLTTLLQKDHEQKIGQLGSFEIFSFISILFLALFLYSRLNKIVGPILQLKKAAEAFQAGNGDYCKKYCHVKTGDEIEVLGNAICGMTQKISRDMYELKKVDRMKTEFLAIISHELRTPLTPIKGYLSLLERGVQGDLSDKQKETINKINIQATHLEHLINSVLDISRIESGRKFEIEREPLSITEELNHTAEGMRTEFEKKEIKFDAILASNLPTISGDGAKIGRLITIILSNAVKFTPKHGTVKLEAQASDKEVTVKTSDTGTGLAKDQLEKIFDKFYQVDSSYTREQGGIGMGLTIAKEIVKAHGGKIWAESEGLGHGSTFIFTLPISG
ncbi:MAG: ATP-binding protein [Candidatus Margulisiibacteriota bacterium]